MDCPILTQNASSRAVLCLHGYGKYLLIGESSYLMLYDIEETHHITTEKIFSTAEIHGIKEYNTSMEDKAPKFLIWGQKSFTLVSLNLQKLSWQLSEEIQIEDWIIDAIWLPDDTSVIMVTAHSSLLCYTIFQSVDDKVQNANLESLTFRYHKDVLTEKRQCSENSLLYCGQVSGISWHSCIVLSGTVFGNIHIWAPWTKPDDFGRNTPILSISEPKGPVFSVQYDDDKKMIAATSDDRSVRVWKVFFTHKDNCKYSTNAWLTCDVQQIYCSFGHTARVWRSLIVKDETVFTCGEDSTICHWSPTGSLLASWIAHPSSNIWSLIYHKDAVFSGGSDGAVKQWKIASQNQGNLVHLPLPSKIANIPGKIEKTSFPEELNHNSFPRSVCLVDPDRLVTIFDNGFLWVCQNENCQWIWKFVFHHPFLKGYCVSSVNSDSSMLALGTLTGHVIILKIGMWKCICEHSICSTKIQSLSFISQNQLLTCCGLGKIQLWTLHHKGSVGEMEHILRCTAEHKLPPCRRPWITAASPLLQETSENICLAVGDPCGNLHFFSPKCVNPKSSFKRLHGRDAITCVKWHNNILITTGRDGHLCYLIIKNGQLELLQNLKLSYGTWLCGIIKMGLNLIIPSFNSDKLKLWNVSKGELMAEIGCGGGHRSWDMLVGLKRFTCSGVLEEIGEVNSELLTCAFLRDGSPVIWNTLASSALTTIKSSTSGYEILCAEPLFIGEEGVLLAFGGEDTLLHIHLLQRGKLSKLITIKSHLSSIRSLTRIVPFYEKDCNIKDVYMVSSGGRAQFKVWRVTLTHKVMEMICNANVEDVENIFSSNLLGELIYCKEITSHMLRAESDMSWKKAFPVSDPETRYMESLAFWINEEQALFILASSDGFLRFFTYCDAAALLLHEQDCESVLFRLCTFRLREHIYLVASTSRGSIIIWNLTVIVNFLKTFDREFEECPSSLFQTLQYHVQNVGLNSIAPNEVVKEELHLVAGGEDGSIHLLKFSCLVEEEHSTHPIHIDICSKARLHAAKVSDLAWLDSKHFCSGSSDQRLIIWRIENDNLIALSVHFSLPDIQGLKLLSSNIVGKDVPDEIKIRKLIRKLVVYGRGIEVFDVSKGI